MSKNNGDYYCVNSLHVNRNINKLESHEDICKNHDYCHPWMLYSAPWF